MSLHVPSMKAFGIGHRGARLITKENTIESFRKCVELGIKMIEFDINITSDQVLVIYHDTKMHDDRNINEMTFAEFQAYDADFPSLENFLTDPICMKSDIKFYFDIKDRLVPVPLMKYLKTLVVQQPNLAKRFWVGSFEPEDVAIALAMRTLDATLVDVLIGGLFEDSDGHTLMDNTAFTYAAMGYNFLSIKTILASKELICECHEKGIAVFAWVINEEAEAAKMLEMNIDGYCGDDMDLLMKYQLKSTVSDANSVVRVGGPNDDC
jgi:glycerophosphoryl diester phosphodiesterase